MPKERLDAEIVNSLYQEFVIEPGYATPKSPSELLWIIVASGVSIDISADSPADFSGMQLRSTIFVNGCLSPSKQMRILAHEWFHALRWLRAASQTRARFYGGEDHDDPELLDEENLARLFEEKFTKEMI